MEKNLHISPHSTFTFSIPENQEYPRLDRYLCLQFPAYSRSFLQDMVVQGCVSINGAMVKKPSVPLKSNDQIAVTFLPAAPLYHDAPARTDLGITVLHEDEHFLVINKPANLVVHTPHANATEYTLVDWILATYKEIKNVGVADRPGIVHRLDKDTSGIIIIPRTPYAHATFGSMFEKRLIQKTYVAVVQGHPKESGSVDLPIARSQTNKTKMATFDPSKYTSAKTRAALTHYKVLEYFEDSALLELKPVTGRTHQIRVHCAAIGYPIIGDVVYGKQSPLISRQALHAKSIAFEFNNKNYLFDAQLPQDFKDLLEKQRSNAI